MMIEKTVRIIENGRAARVNDVAWWLKQPPAARIAAVEEIRREYHLWRYGAEPGFQRVLRIVERQ
jgi:hypothetical protein